MFDKGRLLREGRCEQTVRLEGEKAGAIIIELAPGDIQFDSLYEDL